MSQSAAEAGFIKRRARTLARNASAEGKEDRYLQELTSRFHFALPLKSQDRPIEVDSKYHSGLANEYAVKYLEQIGVTPTPETMKLVHQNAPIAKCRVTAAWKSRGWVADTLYITPHFQRPKAADADAPEETIPFGAADVAAVRALALDGRGKKDPSGRRAAFEEIQSKYVFPFNSHAAVEHGDVEQDAAEEAAQAVGDPEGTRTRARSRELIDENRRVNVQLGKPLDATPKVISVIQQDFVRTFPFARLRRRVTQPQETELKGILRSLPLTRLIGLVAHYIYWNSMRAKATGDYLPPDEAQRLYTTILSTYAELESLLAQHDSLGSILRPLVLLCVKAVVESVLRKVYPLWFQRLDREIGVTRATAAFDFSSVDGLLRKDGTETGATLISTVKEIDTLVNALFDPGAYGQELSMLASSAEGLRLRQQATRRPEGDQRLRNKYNATSTVLRSLYDNPERTLLPFTGPIPGVPKAVSAPTTPAIGASRSGGRRTSQQSSNSEQLAEAALTSPGGPLQAQQPGHIIREEVVGPHALNPALKKQLYELAIARVEGRYKRERADPRHRGRLQILESLRNKPADPALPKTAPASLLGAAGF